MLADRPLYPDSVDRSNRPTSDYVMSVDGLAYVYSWLLQCRLLTVTVIMKMTTDTLLRCFFDLSFASKTKDGFFGRLGSGWWVLMTGV